jgi:hypothetical protein
MKIPQSVRALYQELFPRYECLKVEVGKVISGNKEPRWHYEGRVKGEESFALKLETGRVRNPQMPEDFFACTLVVENYGKIAEAEAFILKHFALEQRRPKVPAETHLEPHSFDFDDLRLYVKWVDDPAQKATGLKDLLFEVQVKTFLQHAWGIATHDFVYKSDDVDWSMSRIAYQVKAMLENAEVSIGEAKHLTGSTMLKKVDRKSSSLRSTIEQIRKRWEKERLPEDLRRLAQTLEDLMYRLNVDFDDFWKAIDEASDAGEGAKTLDLSPYAAIVASLLRTRGADLFKPLSHPRSKDVFVPVEVVLPLLAPAISAKIIRA